MSKNPITAKSELGNEDVKPMKKANNWRTCPYCGAKMYLVIDNGYYESYRYRRDCPPNYRNFRVLYECNECAAKSPYIPLSIDLLDEDEVANSVDRLIESLKTEREDFEDEGEYRNE